MEGGVSIEGSVDRGRGLKYGGYSVEGSVERGRGLKYGG